MALELKELHWSKAYQYEPEKREAKTTVYRYQATLPIRVNETLDVGSGPFDQLTLQCEIFIGDEVHSVECSTALGDSSNLSPEQMNAWRERIYAELCRKLSYVLGNGRALY